MTCSILLKRFDTEDLKIFEFVTSEEDLPRKIRIVLPAPSLKYIVRVSYFEDSGKTKNGLPIYYEVDAPAQY